MAFDVDANGILNVTAVENVTGKKNNIVIRNDKGRLSTEEIERMITEAERYKEQDDEMRAVVAAKNEFEGYVYQIKNMVSIV